MKILTDTHTIEAIGGQPVVVTCRTHGSKMRYHNGVVRFRDPSGNISMDPPKPGYAVVILQCGQVVRDVGKLQSKTD